MEDLNLIYDHKECHETVEEHFADLDQKANEQVDFMEEQDYE